MTERVPNLRSVQMMSPSFVPVIKSAVLWVVLAGLVSLFCAACATVGHEFPDSRVPEIQIGKTTQADIRAMFGEPWRTGIEDGQRTWTYGRYRYSLFGQAKTKDLVIRFDSKGIVVSYSFNTTEHVE